MKRAALRLCALSLALIAAPGGLWAYGTMSGTNETLYPSADTPAGSTATSTNFRLNAAIGEPVSGSTWSSTNFILGPSLLNLMSYPGTITSLSGSATSSTASLVLQWTAPGYDGGLGALQAGTSYYVRLATFTSPNTFAFSNASVLISTSGTNPGLSVGTSTSSLFANTTYYFALWTLDAKGDPSYGSQWSTFTTLSNAVSALPSTYLAVAAGTATVAWAALPGVPSSMTAEGYSLEASSTNFGALDPGGAVFSSFTASMPQSTLTIVGLDFSNTYYFRLGTLNWSGATDYATLNPLFFQIATSSGGLSFGAMDPSVFKSTISISSVVVTNIGNLPATLVLSASTSTLPSSPWTLSTSTGIETAALQGVWNSVQPGPSAFATFLTTTTRVSGISAGNYAGDQLGYQIPPGGTRTLWFQLWLPTSTSDPPGTKETFKTNVTLQYP